ncbi:MAG: hypothetical protein KME27_29595 [Lyngbya sp. HA4199-MV5]|jgi:hypothetical protein|nr:hypothetical protein [Lyngbya sp. HA4199-MV5]
MNRLMMVAIGSLPIVALSCLPKPASAEAVPQNAFSRAPIVIADRDNNDWRNNDRWDNDRRDNDRRDNDWRNNNRRDNDRRDYDWRNNNRRDNDWRDNNRRDYQRRVWIPGHWERGFLGIGRKWVAGHYAYR